MNTEVENLLLFMTWVKVNVLST